MGGKLCNIFDGAKPAIVMVAVQLVFGGVNILYKLAINDGMNTRVLVAYRFIFATALYLLLLSSWKEEHWVRLESLALTSPTFSAAMVNLIPAITFIFAISLGLEKLAIRTWAGKAKVGGTLLGIGGAMVLTFYKGPQINMAKMGERYPYQYSSTALMCAAATVQAIVYATCMEGNWSTWKLGWNIRLLTVAYTRGPLFVSIFNPLMLVFVAILGSLILDEKLHLGSSIIGGVLIVIGLYAMLWAKGVEMKSMARLSHSKSSKEAEIINVGTASAEMRCIAAATNPR
ncbi:WAT1-related protein [Vitis vinifera]|uniref:WAT1-related protein n=1 Tax=Vitis vinifera TaxID=29760 RepID=A0A438CNK8_VITVI|nr:WAT1-related protein [Vitis vinifera]